MRKVFLDDLPRFRYGKGQPNGVVNWSKSVGYKVKFIYDDIEGSVEIIKYDKNTTTLTIIYANGEHRVCIGEFIKCRLGEILKKYTKDFKIKIGDVIESNNRNIVVIDRKTSRDSSNNFWKFYKYRCNQCGFDGNMDNYKKGLLNKEHWIVESGLLTQKNGCACCRGYVTVESINSIYKTTPWMIDLGVDKEEAKKFTVGSNNKIKCICPHCGEISYKMCNKIYNRKSISCKCGDGQSYISKYIYSVLKQLNFNFQTEVKYSWNKYINPKNNKLTQASIDFVIYHNGREIPLEADGGWHRKDNNLSGQTKEQSEYIDKQRDENCLKYLGEETIRISDEGDIRENILNTKLSKEFDLSLVDWLKCEEYALGNLVKEVCDYWNNKEEWETTTDLEKIFGLCKATVIKYLNKGNLLGWCCYNPKEEMFKSNIKNAKLSGKAKSKRVEIFKNEVSLGVFSSCNELSKQSEKVFCIKLLTSCISLVCLGQQKSHKGYTFKYVI